MQLESVISRTGAGMRELLRGASRVDGRQRRLLSVVDGRSSIAQLAVLAGFAAEEALALCADLEKGGYLRELGRADPAEGDLDFTR